MHKEVAEVVRHQTGILKETSDGMESLKIRLDVLEKMLHTLSQHQNVMSPRLHTVSVSNSTTYVMKLHNISETANYF